MKRLLVCTIMRNAGHTNLLTWWNKVGHLISRVTDEYQVALSVIENDSTDGTAAELRDIHRYWVDNPDDRFVLATEFYLSTETLGTQQYGSVWSVDRLRNLANARQRCLDQVGDALGTFDKVAYVEVDCAYDPFWAKELILARHPLAAGLGEPDIYSGWSLRSEANPKESVFLYDTCATRATCYDISWDMTEANGTWRAKTVIPTDLGGHDAMCLHEVWSTFSCFCVYNAEPFKRGYRWRWWNTRLDTGQGVTRTDVQGELAYLEADTVAMCESFRYGGFNKVYLNTNCLIRHS